MPTTLKAGTITRFEDMNERQKKAFLSKPNIVGNRYGRLLVLEFAYSKAKRGLFYKCQCDCGKIVYVPRHKLLRAKNPNRSCGCIANEIIKSLAYKKGHKPINQYKLHGHSSHPLYAIYNSMKMRVLHPNTMYKKINYQDRGITICDEWLGMFGFKNFFEWAIANGWSDERLPNGRHKYTLDRIDNDGNYEPSNCRWATHYEQVHNRRKNRQGIDCKSLSEMRLHYPRKKKWSYTKKEYEKTIQNGTI